MKTNTQFSIGRIPTELTAINQWIVWQKVPRPNGKTDKIPFSPKTNRKCSVTDPNSYDTFDAALACLEEHPDLYDGLGFCLTKEICITGLDLDDALDANGDLKPWAADLLVKLPGETYVELSPSGNGLRAFLAGNLKPGKRKRTLPDGKIEIYDSGRFLTVTGNRFRGSRVPVAQDTVDEIHSTWFAEPSASRQSSSCSLTSTKLSDEEVLSNMFAAKAGGKIKLLWDGDTGKYSDDESAADQALLCHLAFFTGKNPEQMERLFTNSARGQREKWLNRDDYRQRSIQNAIAFVSDVYGHDEALRPGQVRILNDGELRRIAEHIKAMDPSTSKKVLPAILDELLSELATVNEAQALAIIMEDVKNHFAFTDKELSPYLKGLKERRKQLRLESDELPLTAQQALEHLKSTEQVKEIHPALDFVDGVMYFGVMIKGQLFLVSAERKLIDTNEGREF